MWASPPCQPWSAAQQHGVRGEADADRNGWPWTLDLVRAIRPRWLVAENVKGAGDYMQVIVLPALADLFPAVALWMLRAPDYGVPQSRTRLFLVAGPVPVGAPLATHVPADAGALDPRPRWRTMRDAIGVAYDRPSPCVMVNEYKGRPLDPKWWRKLNNASDALAIATNGARRKLTIAEAAALQTFPPDHPFSGSAVDVYRQIGNAVPPLLAAAVLRQVLAAEAATDARLDQHEGRSGRL